MRAELRQMMKNEQHFGNVTIFFLHNDKKWQRKVNAGHVVTPTCPFYNALAVNGLVFFAAVRSKIFVRILIFRDIAWEDWQDLRGTLEIYSMAAL